MCLCHVKKAATPLETSAKGNASAECGALLRVFVRISRRAMLCATPNSVVLQRSPLGLEEFSFVNLG